MSYARRADTLRGEIEMDENLPPLEYATHDTVTPAEPAGCLSGTFAFGCGIVAGLLGAACLLLTLMLAVNGMPSMTYYTACFAIIGFACAITSLRLIRYALR